MTSVKLPASDTLEFAGTIVIPGAAATSSYNKHSIKRVSHHSYSYFSFFLLAEEKRGRLTLSGKVLTWRDGADAGKRDVHDGRGDKGLQEVGGKSCIGEMGLDGHDVQRGVAGGLGINECGQERKNDCGCEDQHDGCRQL